VAKGFEIGVGVDTKAAKQAIDAGLVEPLEDAQKELKDLGDSRGPEDLERSLRDAQDATQRLERETKQAADAIEDEYRRAYGSQKQAAQSAASTSTETMKEVKAEALANASEVFSSFDGSASSFVDGIQGTFGGLIAGLAQVSPAMIPVAAAAAITIGTVAAAVTGAEERTEEFRAKVAELTAEFIETGTIGGRSFSGMADEVRELVAETDQSRASLDRLSGLAKDLGSNFEDVVTAYTQGGSSLDDLIDKTESLAASERIRALELQGFNDYQSAEASAHAADLEHELGLLRDQRDAIAEASIQQELYYKSGVSELEAKAGLIEAINTAYDDAAGSTQDFLDVESGVFDVAAYIESMTQREEALRNYQRTLSESELSDQAKAFLNEQGAEAAAAMLAGYQSASPAQRAELDRIWSEAARANSGTYLDTVTEKFGEAKVVGPEVEMQAPDVGGVLSTMQRQLDRGSLRINADVYTRNGQRVV